MFKMQRYLMHVSYIGTHFRGVQKIINHNEPYKPDPTTIQGNLEIALERLKSVNTPCVVPSSRTDTGVHALQSTFHVDLLRRNSKPYDAKGITANLNKYFYKQNIQIRLLKTQQISQKFHCRFNAKSRTYLYRLGILKNEFFNETNKYVYHIPIEELNRCYFLTAPNFDVQKMQNACKLFEGLHDFRSFMAKASHVPNKMTRRTIEFITMTEARPSFVLDQRFRTGDDIYTYWNITLKSEGFLYNQVRRIVGTLIAVGQGKVNETEVKCMLQVPSHLTWYPQIVPAPSHGLYLCKVDYSSDDLEANILK